MSDPASARRVWNNPYVRAACLLGGAYLAWVMLVKLASVLVMAVIAYLLAYLANPFLSRLERLSISRPVGVAVVVVLSGSAVFLSSLLFMAVGRQLLELTAQLPLVASRLHGLIEQSLSWLDLHSDVAVLRALREQLSVSVDQGAQELTRRMVPFVQDLLRAGSPLASGLSAAAGLVGQVALTLILALYFMMDYPRVGAALLRLAPTRYQPLLARLSGNIEQAVGGYLRGQLIIAAAVGSMVWLGLALLGVPNAAALGFLAGAFNIVPFLGAVVGLVPAVLLALPLGTVKVLLVVGVFVAANQIESHVLSPQVLGRTTNLHPVVILLSILGGLSLFGLVGAVVAVPLTALGKVLLDEYYYPSRIYAAP